MEIFVIVEHEAEKNMEQYTGKNIKYEMETGFTQRGSQK